MSTSQQKVALRCSCGTVSAVPVGAAALKVFCPKCRQPLQIPQANAAITAKPAAATPPVGAITAQPRPAAPAADVWYAALDKKKVGPLTKADVLRLIAEKRLSPSDMVLTPGQTKWAPAAGVPGLFDQPAPALPFAEPVAEASLPFGKQIPKNWLIGGGAGAGALVLLLVVIIMFRGRGDPNQGNQNNGGNQGKPAVEVPKVALNTTYISNDFHGALVLHPRRFLDSRLAKRIVPQAYLLAAEKDLGLPLNQVEQLIVVVDHAKPGADPGKPPEPKDNWIAVDSKEGRYSARFPAAPKADEFKTLGLGTRKLLRADVDDGKHSYEVSYIDLPPDLAGGDFELKLDTATRALEFMVGFKSKKFIVHNKQPGAEVVIDDKQPRTTAVHRVLVVGNRAYQISVTSRGAEHKAEDVAKFFDAFRPSAGGAVAAGPGELLGKELMPLPGMVIRFSAAVDGNAIIGRMLRDAKPVEFEGKRGFRGDNDFAAGMPQVALAIDDQTILVAVEPVLKKMLAADGRGWLVDRLTALQGAYDVALVVNLKPYQEKLNEAAKQFVALAPPPWDEGVAVAGRIDAVQLSVDARAPALVSVQVDATDESAARTVEKLARSGVDLAKAFLPALQPMLNDPAISKAGQKDLRHLAANIFTGLELKTSGTQVALTIARPARQAPAALVAAWKPHLPKADQEQVSLGGEATDVAVGGGGRFLIYHLKGQKKLAILDLQKGEVVKHIPVADDNMLFTAGAQKLVIANLGQRLLVPWNLQTLEQEKAAPLPPELAGDATKQMAMGSASTGPVFFSQPMGRRVLSLDLASLTVGQVRMRHFNPNNAWGPEHLRLSADGQTLVAWGGGWAGLELARFEQGVPVDGSDKFTFGLGVFASPSADGRYVFHQDAVVTPDGQPTKARGYLVPAREPGFYLSLEGGPLPLGVPGQALNLPGVNQVTIHTESNTPLVILKDLEELKAGSAIPWDKTVHYYPESGLLVTLAGANKAVLRRVNLIERLDAAGVDYLFVRPQPAVAKLGVPFEHKLDIRSKRGGVQAKLVAGPDGMKVSAEGEIAWPVPADFADDEAIVVVSVRDQGGQEVVSQVRVAIVEE